MKYEPKNIHHLKLLKQQFKYEVRLQEEMLASGTVHFKNTFVESLKSSARFYSQKLITVLLIRLLQSKKNS